MGQTLLYSIIWGVISFTLATWLMSLELWITSVLGFLMYVFCSLCVVTAIKRLFP